MDDTRINVQQVAVWYERLGMSPDEIVTSWPQLTLADVHAAPAYYDGHREMFERQLREDEEFVQRLLTNQPSLLKKLRERNARDDSLPPG